MQQALDSVYYIFDKFIDLIFSVYIFNGVSIGMLLVGATIFTILLRYLLAVPNISVPVVRKKED